MLLAMGWRLSVGKLQIIRFYGFTSFPIMDLEILSALNTFTAFINQANIVVQ
jgi:hypothetical protein